MIPITFIYILTLIISTLATPTYFQDRTACATTATDPKANLRNAYNTCNNQDEDGCPCLDLSMSEKQAILDVHNQRREKVAAGEEDCYDPTTSTRGGKKCPAAKNMNYLFWDNGLEQVANYWAHQCIETHQSYWPSPYSSSNKNTFTQLMYKAECDESPSNCHASGYDNTASSQYSSIGENLARYWWSTNTYDFDDILNGINKWYDESIIWNWAARDDVPWSAGGITSGKHFTQGVWDKTRLIGCGYAICNSNSQFNYATYPTWINIVCKYYPAGNFLTSQDPYEAATTNSQKCTNCDSDRPSCVSAQQSTSNYNSLCGGNQCSSCGPDKGAIARCTYSPTSCPDAILTTDGTGGTRDPTPSPTSPTPSPTSSSSDIYFCNYIYGGFNGAWTYDSVNQYYTKNTYYTNPNPFVMTTSGSPLGIKDGAGNGWYAKCTQSTVSSCTAGQWQYYSGGWQVDSDAYISSTSCPDSAESNIKLEAPHSFKSIEEQPSDNKSYPLNMTEMHVILAILILVLIIMCGMIFGFFYYLKKNKKSEKQIAIAQEHEMVYFERENDEHNTPTIEHLKDSNQNQPSLKINVNGTATMVTKLPTTTPVTPLINLDHDYE